MITLFIPRSIILASSSSIYSGCSNTCSISYSNGSDNDW